MCPKGISRLGIVCRGAELHVRNGPGRTSGDSITPDAPRSQEHKSIALNCQDNILCS